MTDPSNAAAARGPRRDRLADVFGDVLPETTSDERLPDRDSSATDTWYQDNRPPHHDRDH